MKIKKIVAVILALTLIFALASCGTAKKDAVVIKVAASPTPHAQILEIAKEILAEDGITLEIIEFTDYVQPNLATDSGDVDANYFQHMPYLEQFNGEHNTQLSSVAAIHYEPYGIYPGRTATIEELQNGAKISVPNDATNEARALLLLEAQGLIKLTPNIGLKATKLDIIENPLNLDIIEMEAASLTLTLPDVDMAVINGNYAIDAGLSVAKDAVAIEDSSSETAQIFANILVVKTGNENNENIQVLVKALQSQKVKDFINATYDGAVLAMF